MYCFYVYFSAAATFPLVLPSSPQKVCISQTSVLHHFISAFHSEIGKVGKGKVISVSIKVWWRIHSICKLSKAKSGKRKRSYLRFSDFQILMFKFKTINRDSSENTEKCTRPRTFGFSDNRQQSFWRTWAGTRTFTGCSSTIPCSPWISMCKYKQMLLLRRVRVPS